MHDHAPTADDQLARIDRSTTEGLEALHEQGEILRVTVERLDMLVELLASGDDREGVPLDELLAHLIRQNAEQLTLAKRLLEAIEKLGNELPAAVVKAVKPALSS